MNEKEMLRAPISLDQFTIFLLEFIFPGTEIGPHAEITNQPEERETIAIEKENEHVQHQNLHTSLVLWESKILNAFLLLKLRMVRSCEISQHSGS